MRYKFLPILLVFLVFLLAFPEAEAKVKPRSVKKMWIFSQKSKLLGDMVLVVSKNQMKVYRPGIGVSILAKAGDPKVTVLNSNAKVYSRLTVKQFATQEDSRLAMLQGYLESIPMEKVRDKKSRSIFNLTTSHYRSKSVSKPQKKSSRSVGNVIDVGNLKIRSANLWTSKTIALNPAFQSVIHSIYKLPKVAGIPLLMNTVEDSGEKSIPLVTRKAVQSPYNSATFNIPKNMKLVDDYAKVIHSSSNLNSLMNYFDIMHNSRLKK